MPPAAVKGNERFGFLRRMGNAVAPGNVETRAKPRESALISFIANK